MDALTAPRAFRKTESMSQNKIRGLGIEESDSKNNMDSKNNVSHHYEATKPRGKSQDAGIVLIEYTLFYFYRGNEV